MESIGFVHGHPKGKKEGSFGALSFSAIHPLSQVTYYFSFSWANPWRGIKGDKRKNVIKAYMGIDKINMKEFWDFNENVNFSMVRGYKVLNIYTNLADAAKLLNVLEFTIHKSLMSIRRTEKITAEINLLLTTPFKLQEMQLEELQGSVIFEGLNKLKYI